MASLPPIIAWDYQFAPNAQKSRNYLYATQTPFKICEQPFVLPRPILTNLGITYRRVPVLSIGKDVFCDNAAFIDALQKLLEKERKGLKRSGVDRAFEAWGYRSFWVVLPCVPSDIISPQLAKDRENLFPVFAREDFATLQATGTSEMRAMLETVEHEFLNDQGPWVGGSECGLADIHAIWIIKWFLQTLGYDKNPSFDRQMYPKLYRWIESLPLHSEAETKDMHISAEEATTQILGSKYAMPDIGVDEADPLQLKAGETVAVEATDAKPGTYPQFGQLVGLDKFETVVELDNGLRVHFPKVGYAVRKAPKMVNGN